MFVAGWRHALRSEWPFIIIIIKGLGVGGAEDGVGGFRDFPLQVRKGRWVCVGGAQEGGGGVRWAEEIR